jgi:hypothetical protein
MDRVGRSPTPLAGHTFLLPDITSKDFNYDHLRSQSTHRRSRKAAENNASLTSEANNTSDQ